MPLDLHRWADLTSILTLIITFIGAVVGIYGYTRYRYDLCRKSKGLEKYLRDEKTQSKGADKGQRSILHIIRYVGLTEDEIIQASFRNPRIARRVTTDHQTGLARDLLFEYDENK